jgi:hypothetical protein
MSHSFGFKPGDPISTAEQFDTLPLGATLTDADGWVHTKVAQSNPPGETNCHAVTTYVDSDGDVGTFFQPWNFGAVLTTPPRAEEPTGRPTVTLTKDTSREYALRSNSRKIDEPLRRVLDAAAQGETVDAVEFRKAVTAALSLAATRAGQSMGRREFTKMARHLLYIADAVIDNHIDGLPAYAEGDRSRAVEAFKTEVTEAQRAAESLADYLEAERVRANEAEAALRLAEADREALREKLSVEYAVMANAYSFLSVVDRARVEGFREGFTTRP